MSTLAARWSWAFGQSEEMDVDGFHRTAVRLRKAHGVVQLAVATIKGDARAMM